MSIRRGARIAFCGAGGTGKTTSAEYISKELEIPVLKSSSRQVYEDQELTEDTVLELTDAEKLKLQTDIFKNKMQNDRHFSYVADRSILDHYAYCLAYCGHIFDNNQFVEYEETTQTHMLSAYSHIFYFPWGFWMADGDGVRQDKWAWQSQIDAIIVGYLHRWGVACTTVPQIGGVDHRNEFIKQHIIGVLE
jgi:nicotinamide riboside kinase